MTHRYLPPLALSLAAAALLTPRPAAAEPTLELYVQGQEMFEGDPESASIDAQGYVSTGPVLRDLTRDRGQPVVALVAGARGSLFAGTAGGGLLEIRGGEARVVDAFEGQVVSALARDGGRLFVATAPDGRIVTVAGKMTKPFYKPEAKYIWAMRPEASGLLAATGHPGQLLRIGRGGKAEVLFDPGESHLRALARHPTRGLVVGGGQKGIVYQLEAAAPGAAAFALYDSPLDEVTAFAVDAGTGDLYAAVVSASKKGALEPTTWIGPVKGDDADDESNPIESSEVVRIRANGHVEKVWTSKREGALDLAFDARAGHLIIATGTGLKNRARLYAVDTRDRDRVRLLARLEPSLATRIVPGPKGSLRVGTAPFGRIIEVGPGAMKASVYRSVEQDLERISDIGRLWFDAAVPRGAKVSLRLRTGNTATPDETWSAWTEAVTDPLGGDVTVRRGRYAQFEARLATGPRGEAPVLKSMHASVVRMNVPPEISEVFLLRRGVYLAALPSEGEKERTVSLSSSVLRGLRGPDKDEDRVRVRQGESPGMRTVAWKAEDANGDALLYRVQLRRLDDPDAPPGEAGWQTVGDDLEHTFFTFDSRAYPDGRYQFRILATDRPANPPDGALGDRLDSEPFTVDNAPPVVRGVRAVARGGRVTITAEASDAASALREAVFSVDGGPWLMLPAKDGLTDAPSEVFEVALEGGDGPGQTTLPAGPHSLRVRVTDRADNEASAAARFTTK